MKSKPDVFGRALAVGTGLQKQEQKVAIVLAGAQDHRLSVGEIRPRFNPATRALDAVHVMNLAESIAALGLIEPLAVDTEHRLVAGGHRFAAMRLLSAALGNRAQVWLELFGSDPSKSMSERLELLTSSTFPVAVHVLSIDSANDPGTALAVEIAENERRRSYTKEEIRTLAATLKAVGYRDGVGRPKHGERTVIPALSAVLGKSRRTVCMMLASLAAEANEASSVCRIHPSVSEDRRLKAALTRWLDKRDASQKTRAMAEALLRSLGETGDLKLTIG